MQIISRVVQLEEGKENGISVRTGQYKAFRPKLLLILGLFFAVVVTIFIISVSTINYTGLQSVVTTVTSTFVPCREEDESNSLSRWIQPPPGVLMHNMTDEELLWRASFWPRRKGYPFKRVPKIAFMFLTKGPLPLASLWERFLKGHEGLYSVYVHPDPSYTAKFPPDSVFYKRQIPSQVAEWGRMTMCDAEKRLLANALLDISNEWFVLVSESCIPLYNFTTIYSYLSQSKHSFMGAVDVPGPFGRGRYNKNMEPEVPITKWRKGPQWFEVDRDLAATIVEDTLYYPKFREFCRPACYSDEHYFPTMLTIEEPMKLANRSVTWMDWSRGGPHPATFGEWDVTEKFFEKIFDVWKLSIMLGKTLVSKLVSFMIPLEGRSKLLTDQGFVWFECEHLVQKVLVSVVATVASAQSESPAPSPTSGSGAFSPSIVSAGVAAVAALVFGSALRI